MLRNSALLFNQFDPPQFSSRLNTMMVEVRIVGLYLYHSGLRVFLILYVRSVSVDFSPSFARGWRQF
jgi:hypothetical protein